MEYVAINTTSAHRRPSGNVDVRFYDSQTKDVMATLTMGVVKDLQRVLEALVFDRDQAKEG